MPVAWHISVHGETTVHVTWLDENGVTITSNAEARATHTNTDIAIDAGTNTATDASKAAGSATEGAVDNGVGSDEDEPMASGMASRTASRWSQCDAGHLLFSIKSSQGALKGTWTAPAGAKVLYIRFSNLLRFGGTDVLYAIAST